MSIKKKVAINATKTIKEKLTLEREIKIQGLVIKGYHTDNRIFYYSYFMKNLFKKKQEMRFIGAGASRQNSLAERAINILVTMERIMLMHDALICPEDTLSNDIWRMEIYYSVWVYNSIPDMQPGISDIGIW